MATFPLKPAAPRNIGLTIKMIKLSPEAKPACPALKPLTWHTGTTDETVVTDVYSSGTVFCRMLAVVIGSWPPDTEFVWTVTHTIPDDDPHYWPPPPPFITMGNALMVATNQPGWLTATVKITAPDCPAKTLGPITLTVITGGCC
jgi:hypothetical protein